MLSVEPCQLPENALLSTYFRSGAYTDCYKTEIHGAITHHQYVYAFYTSLLFKLERAILNWLVSKPSTDVQAKQLAEHATNNFSAWSMENRCTNQLLMCDYQNRTRSWLMIEPIANENGTKTFLYFGSAIVPVKNKRTGKMSLGPGFRSLLGFHKLYSVLLLYSAKSRLMK